MRVLIRLLPVALLGAAAAVLVSCGSSGTGLIPSASAGPLQSDFEAVAQAAATGNGSCAATESALGKTEQDFLALPASVDGGLHRRLQQGIANLRKQALAMCIQPAPTDTSTVGAQTSTTTTTSTETTPTTTTSTTTTPTATQTPTTATPPNPGGGTEAPGEQSEESQSKGKGNGNGNGEGKGKEAEGEGSGGANAGGANAGGGQ